MARFAALRTGLGVWLKDVPRYACHLWLPGGDYLAVRNRGERLELGPGRQGYRGAWQWTSDLHAPRHLPLLGRALLRRALGDHPIRRKPAPGSQPATPDVSFIIGHRGAARLPALLATLETIAAQRTVGIECWVVEQDTQPTIRDQLPSWVRYVHTPPPSPDMPYCRSWAFNVGAVRARGKVLVLHDNDMLVPHDYAEHAARIAAMGYHVVNLKRFIFFLGEEHTRLHVEEGALLDARAPQTIMQNAEGGGSIAITREAFNAIGGMDESFVGWGGEDNDLWDRARTLRVWPWAFLGLVHLFHESQPGKHESGFQTARHYREMAKIDPAARIARLNSVSRGRLEGPAGWHPPTVTPNPSCAQ